MPTFTTRDGTEIYYKDWGNQTGPVVTFSHGWPLSSDNWDAQMFFFASQGYRAIAHDRRGHGRSAQPWEGNDMDTYADDLHELFVHLDLKDATMVGHSTGGGEVARFIGRHGTDRVKKAVLIGAVPPIMVQSESNPEGTPLSVFDSFRASILNDRSQFFLDVPSGPFFGFNRPNAKVSQGQIYSWWQQGMTVSVKGAHDCVKEFSETDFTEDLEKMGIPVLLLHGDDDQIVPIEAAAKKAIKLLPQGTLKIYPGGPHALPNIHPDEVNKDILEFIKA
ncbi:Alpha/Beta hydrolase protein [Podospora aff. communis PSN243]|uniref:Alpha/Beta hydrolase protein n=1 Tax=Podospora aff. communis PSN243 TaxID=3040156 RepID=A0AAV9GDC3_9PEZI|nr:Alpha/Beta hydrolase protein [Podospora aff. communis PSN243]